MKPVGTNCPAAPGGCFTLTLPAAGPVSAPFGSLYDLAVAGGSVTYGAARLPPLYPGQTIAVDPKQDFNVTGNQTLGNLTGSVRDACAASTVIAGATLQLLVPQDIVEKPAADFCMTSPEQCISVATANTDNAGNFPLPPTITSASAFGTVPILGKNANPYVMEVTAPGYDPLFVQAIPGTTGSNKGAGTCSINGGPFKICKLAMTSGTIKGSFAIVPPNSGEVAQVQVFAEDHGTNNVENALPMPITVTSNKGVTGCSPPDGTVCANFNLRVPTTNTVGAFDLFASTIDLYQKISDPYPGHSIVTISNVAAPGVCETMTVPTTTDPNQVISCVGHGSIVGSVGNANLGASVVLEKLDPANDDEVQLTSSIIQNQSPTDAPATNRIAFCAPADTYQVQEFQLPLPAPGVAPIAAASPSPVPGGDATVTIPPPPPAGGASPTPTPAIKCPTNCSHPDGTCPGICISQDPELPALPPLPTAVPTMTPTATATP